jgi:hypothetical protein
MTDPLNENNLKAEFRRLRDTEMRAAPSYRQTRAAPAPAAPRRRMQPALQFALVALLVVAASAVLFDRVRDRSMPETAEIGPSAPADGDRLAAFEMPTDFLLETPWFDLASTTPDFDFEFPQYDIPEDLSDET